MTTVGRSVPFVSVLMLVHNAPRYTEIAIRSLRNRTVGIRYELIVVDNRSDERTREVLRRLNREGFIDRLETMTYNSLFAKGNNVAAELASPDASHFLLLNSDVRVRSERWLPRLLEVHKPGITSYGVATDPLRVDGYCLLIDADLYRSHPLDEGHQWWWGVTKQQAALLSEGFSVQGWAEHERYLHHYGGRSGSAFKSARGMNVTREEVQGWFGGREAHVIDRQLDGEIPRARVSPLMAAWRVLRSLIGRVRR